VRSSRTRCSRALRCCLYGKAPLFSDQLTRGVIPTSTGTAWCTTEVLSFGFQVGLYLLVLSEVAEASLAVCHAALGGGAAKLRRALNVASASTTGRAPYRLAERATGGDRSRAGLSLAAGEGLSLPIRWRWTTLCRPNVGCAGADALYHA